MTQDKDFKRVVRDRMARTGESYTSARAQLRSAALAKETPRGGRTPETAALARAFAALGVPLSEAMLFGIGGGIGIAYFVFEYKLGAGETWITLFLGGRINPFVLRATRGAREDAELSDVACARAGLPFVVRQSSSAKAAEKQLREALERGRQVIAIVDEASLGHGMPKHLGGMMPCPIGVALEGGAPVVVDLDGRPRPTTWPELARWRANIKSVKHRFLELDAPRKPLDVARAALAGLAETSRGMLTPPMKNFGLSGLAKWADLVADARDKKGWPTLFRDGKRLGQALKWVAHWIVGPGSDGGFLRGLYADFLDEAADLLGRGRLRPIATQYRALAEEWAGLAAAVLPRSIPQLEPICSLLAFKRCLLERHGGAAAAEELRALDAELGSIDEELARAPLSEAAARAVLDELRARLLALHEGETRAAQALAAAAGD